MRKGTGNVLLNRVGLHDIVKPVRVNREKVKPVALSRWGGSRSERQNGNKDKGEKEKERETGE
jgi:hypothetical protein